MAIILDTPEFGSINNGKENDTVCVSSSTYRVCYHEWYERAGYTITPFDYYVRREGLTGEFYEYLLKLAKVKYPIGTKFKFKNQEYVSSTEPWIGCNFGDNFYIAVRGKAEGGCCYTQEYGWAEIVKEPSLKPKGLIRGEIYFDDDTERGFDNRIIRFDKKNNKTISIISQIYESGNPIYYCGFPNTADTYCYTNLREATLAEKAKLIKAELKHGYFWDGKDLVKIQ